MNYHLPFIVSLRFLKRVQSNLIGLSKSVTFLIHNQSSIDQRFWWQSPNDLVWNLVGIKLQLERQSCQLGTSVLLILWDSQSNLQAEIWFLFLFLFQWICIVCLHSILKENKYLDLTTIFLSHPQVILKSSDPIWSNLTQSDPIWPNESDPIRSNQIQSDPILIFSF